MANPLDTLKKLKGRSWDEIRTRGGQAFSVYSEQIGLSGKLPSDGELKNLLDRKQFGKTAVTERAIFDKFRETSEYCFFPGFREPAATIETFRHHFGEKSARFFIEQAEKNLIGKFDLLGLLNLDFGADVDWHLEPLAKKRSPLKHWKQFDELDTAETGDKKIVWELNRHQHFFNLGTAYQLTGDERFAAAFARHLESWMQQNPPGVGVNWVSSLEIAFRVMSWIWAFNMFKDSPAVTPQLFCRALKYLYLQGRHIEKYLSTYYSPNTHLTGEALGLYYLGTQLSFFNRASHWRRLGENILLGELDRQILPDGVYFEQSSWYQRYTTDFYAHFLILKTLCGASDDENDKKAGAKIETKLQAALDFLMYITRPDGTTPIIGDDDGGRMLPLANVKSDDFRGSLAVGAALFERGDYKFVAENLSEHVVWLLGAEGAAAFETLRAHVPNANSAQFEAGGYFVLRDGWSETDNYLLIDCGDIGALSGGHGHADTLAVNLSVRGKTLLTDSGTYSYHESNDIRDYFRSSQAHNTLTIDEKSSSAPGGKFSWNRKANARVRSWISQDRFDFFEGWHDGYEEIGARHQRSVLFLKNDYFVMRDYVETAGQHDYALNFHFRTQTSPAIEDAENGGFCIGESPTAKQDGWRLFTFGDNGGWQRKESWTSTNYGEKVNSPFLRFKSKGGGAQEFFTFVLPSDAGGEQPEIFETSVSGGRAFVINYRGYWDLFVFADANDQIVRTEIFNTNFRFLWARLGAGEQMPEEFVMVGGTNFTLGSRVVINYPNELEFAVARRLGSKLNVRTSENLFSVSLPKKDSLRNAENFAPNAKKRS